MKKTLIRIAIANLVLLVALLIAAPFFINTAPLKSKLEQSISQKLGANFSAQGKLKISFLPIPKISLKNATISKLITDHYSSDINIHRLIIKPNIFSLLKGKIEIGSLVFENPNIDSKYFSKIETQEQSKAAPDKVVQDNILNHIFNFTNNGTTFNFQNIKSIQCKNGSFVRHNTENEVALEFRSINFSLKNDLKKQIFRVEGGFLSDGEPTSFLLVANAKNKEESSLIIQSAILNLSLSGKFSDSNIDDLIRSNFSGKVEAQIIDLKAFLSKYVSKNNLLYRKINSTEPIKISAQIENKAGVIDIENIAIKSALMEGSGNILANFVRAKPEISANFDFNNIDIDSVWFSGALNNSSNLVNFENEIIQNFLAQPIISNDENKTYFLEKPIKTNSANPFFNNLDFGAKIKIKLAKYYENDLHNISLNFITTNNNLLLQPLSVEIPGSALLKVEGVLERDNDIPKFIGKVEIVGQDLQKSLSWLGFDTKNLKPKILNNYNLKSDLLILPSFNVLTNFNLAINDNKNIVTGDLKIDDSTGISNANINLRINYFNYDDYFDDKPSPYLSRGSLLKKLLWLGTIDAKRDISLSFDQLVYHNENFNNQGLKIKFGQGYLKFSDLNFSSANLDLKGGIEFDISNNSPKINIDLSANNFQYQSQLKSADKNLNDLFFDLPALDEFSGNIAINIQNLLIDSWQANNVKIAGKIKNGIVNFDNFNLKTYQGEVKYKGSMVLKNSKTINGSLELIGVDSGKILDDLLNIKNISGISNFSAVLNSSAENKTEFLKNLDANGQFIGANIAIKGFGVYDLAVKMAQLKKYQEELSKPENILYNSETVSIFKDVSGAFAIKKNNPDQFSIKASSLGINGVISGEFDATNQNLDANANFIFISGTRQNQVPINIAVNFKGKAGAIEKNNNLGQIDQYLKQRLAIPTP
ncbi:MAG: AsmA family protein [Pseudomonadota bacterium]